MALPVRTIVAAVDLQDDMWRPVLQTAHGLAESLGAKLFVVDVWPRLQDVGFPYARMAEKSEIKDDAARRQARRKNLEKEVLELAPEASADVLVGDVEDAILFYLKKVVADMLVIGSHQKGFWARAVSGSASEEIAHNAPCAVLMVTPEFAAKFD